MGLPRLIEQNKKRHAHQIGKQPECGPKPVIPQRRPGDARPALFKSQAAQARPRKYMNKETYGKAAAFSPPLFCRL